MKNRHFPLLLLTFAFLCLTNIVQAQTIEDFETETIGSTTFTDNSQTFTINSTDGYDIETFTGGGWNGTTTDNDFIDNSNAPGDVDDNDGTSFSITSASDFIVKDVYVFVANPTPTGFTNPTTGTLTVTANLNGGQQYSFTISSGFSDVGNFTPNNGFTFIDFSDQGGSDYSNTVIDELIFTGANEIDYLALDAFRWDVAPSNSIPTATPPTAPTVLEDASNVALADDIDVADTDGNDQTLTFTITGGTLTLGTAGISFGGGGNSSASFTAQGTLANINAALDAATFTPTADISGTNAGTISFTTNDGIETSSAANVTFDITPVNDEPSFTPGSNQNILEDAGVQNVMGWATNIDKGATNESGQTLTFTVTNDNNALFSGQPTINASGNLTYTPAANANGSATVSVDLTDDGGTANSGDDTFATQQFTITVFGVNDEPSFTSGADEDINEDAGAQTVNGWATSIDKGAADESGQTLTFTVTNDNNALFSAQPAIDASGNLTYTPATDANGAATVSIDLTDDGGTTNGGDNTFATQQFTITVNAVNDEPSFTPGGNEMINENAGAQTVNGWATNINKGASDESGQSLTFTVVNNNNGLFSTQPAIDTSGNLTYTPASNTTGTATVSVVLTDDGGTANGGDDTFATQMFTIEVAPVLSNQDELFSGLTIYPIPANNSITISSGTHLKLERVEIFDIQGKLINSKELNQNINYNIVDVSYIPKGLYLLKVSSEKNTITTRITIK